MSVANVSPVSRDHHVVITVQVLTYSQRCDHKWLSRKNNPHISSIDWIRSGRNVAQATDIITTEISGECAKYNAGYRSENIGVT